MSDKVSGLVVEMSHRTCVLLTPDGDFVEAAKPSGRKLNTGEEATLNRYQPFRLHRALALTACLMIVIMGWTAFSTYVPVAVAYVSLDINPSLELAVGSGGQVIKATGFNQEAESLLQQVEVRGKPIAEAIEGLISTAVEMHYIDPGKTNEILVTIEVEPKASPEVVSQKVVEETIVNTITKKNVEANLAVASVDPVLRQQASQQKVSTGRYLLYQESKNLGKPIEVKEIKELQSKKLDELGYQNWSSERIRYLQKNQGNYTNQKNEKTNQNIEYNNRQKPFSNMFSSQDQYPGKNQIGPYSNQDKNDQWRSSTDDQGDDASRSRWGNKDNQERGESRDETIENSRSQEPNPSDRSPWNMFNSQSSWSQKFKAVREKWKTNKKSER